jgi:hypothetical protein
MRRDHIVLSRAAGGDGSGGLRLVGRFFSCFPDVPSPLLFEHEVRTPLGRGALGLTRNLGAEVGASPRNLQLLLSKLAGPYARPERISPVS